MRRIGILSRIILFLMILILAAIPAGIGFRHWKQARWRRPVLDRASHMAQAAAIIDCVLAAKPETVPTLLRAVSGNVMRAGIFADVPPSTDLIEAPKVAEKVRSLMRTPTAVRLRAYTDGNMKGLAYRGEGLEGVVRRVVVPLPSGLFLVVGVIVFVPDYGLQKILGMPSGFWIGLLGCLVAVFALFGALRELGTLRQLTDVVSRFDGRASHAVAAALGESDLGRLVEAVSEMQTRITTLVRERTFLIGAISHDAKTYLTRLRLRTETIADASLRTALERDIDAMSELMETSLAYARGTAVAQQHGSVDLADLVAAEIAEREAIGVPFEFSADLTQAACVDGDAVALRRVIANLLDNAAKFGRSRAEVRVEIDDARCLFSVADDGSGVTADQRAMVFGPFYRVEGSRNRRTGGAGLGLAIAHQIVRAHGGAIKIVDGPLGGALFRVTLPLVSTTRPMSMVSEWKGFEGG